MNVTEHQIAYGTGTLTVRDYGGQGPAVILVHAAGFCALAWDQVGEALGGHVRAVALDLPGHGGSTAPMRRASDAWKAIIAVTEVLELTKPLLVGISQGSHACLAATIEEPDTFAGVVTFGGACVRSEENAEDEIAFYTSPQFTELLRQRFFFGSRGRTRKEAHALADHIAVRLAKDWRVIGFKGLREEIMYSIRSHPEGGWVNLPLPQTILAMISFEEGDRFYPAEKLFDRVRVPVVIVQLGDGLDREHANRERDLALENDLVTVRGLDAGDYPHYTRHHEVASIILETCGVTSRPAVAS
ncbi:alpha/beta hydrolase [Mobilicoccus pelagius]|uniref:AB hydrolase-1 domain-containing protein n=1 Tax=Mobilicoccus pelagius NBRC 104925 TaxID=1089455 RepID=H5UPY9_9MICO|nr:alpha/beta hydrolase [Mobilicoccus pelagius]GAB47794.1 hypothetical protein MOPEL_029_00740 [Mobilicoccus pelagius NBRC 104925]